MTTFPTPGPIAATLELAGARVRVTASDRTDTVVTVQPIDDSRKAVKVAERTTVDFSAGRLSVKTKTAGERNGSVAITIELPTGSDLALYLAHSTVQVDGELGGCELHLASGQVQLGSVAALTADLASGDVTIDRVAGGATINGATFGMRIGEAVGTVVMRNSGGSLHIGTAAGGVDLAGARVDVQIERADGDATVDTSGGAIRIGRMSRGRARLRNASGDIRIGIAEGVPASVDATSDRGAVHDLVSTQPAPAAGSAPVLVHAHTRNGDIVIERAA